MRSRKTFRFNYMRNSEAEILTADINADWPEGSEMTDCKACSFFHYHGDDKKYYCHHTRLREPVAMENIAFRPSAWQYCPKLEKNQCVYDRDKWCCAPDRKREIGFCVMKCFDEDNDEIFKCQKARFDNVVTTMIRALKRADVPASNTNGYIIHVSDIKEIIAKMKSCSQVNIGQCSKSTANHRARQVNEYLKEHGATWRVKARQDRTTPYMSFNMLKITVEEREKLDARNQEASRRSREKLRNK